MLFGPPQFTLQVSEQFAPKVFTLHAVRKKCQVCFSFPTKFSFVERMYHVYVLESCFKSFCHYMLFVRTTNLLVEMIYNFRKKIFNKKKLLSYHDASKVRISTLLTIIASFPLISIKTTENTRSIEVVAGVVWSTTVFTASF